MITMDDLYRLSGLSLGLGGLLATVGWLSFAVIDPGHQDYKRAHWLPLNFLIIAGGVFMAMGLPGFYLWQSSHAGIWGLIGFAVLFVGTVIPYIAVHSIETVTMPDVPAEMMHLVFIGAPSLLVGILITGVVIWVNEIYPQAVGAALILSAVLGPLTVIPSVPQLLRRNLIPAFYTSVIAWVGFWLMGR